MAICINYYSPLFVFLSDWQLFSIDYIQEIKNKQWAILAVWKKSDIWFRVIDFLGMVRYTCGVFY